MLNWFNKSRNYKIAGEALYREIVARARTPEFYRDLAVPDTVNGRFEMITLLMFAVLRRLRSVEGASDGVAPALVGAMFEDLDDSMREMGVSDTVVPKRMRKASNAFYVRLQCYDEAIARPEELEDNLTRFFGDDPNVLPGAKPLEAAGLARYLIDTTVALERQDGQLIGSGQVQLPMPAASPADM